MGAIEWRGLVICDRELYLDVLCTYVIFSVSMLKFIEIELIFPFLSLWYKLVSFGWRFEVLTTVLPKMQAFFWNVILCLLSSSRSFEWS